MVKDLLISAGDGVGGGGVGWVETDLKLEIGPEKMLPGKKYSSAKRTDYVFLWFYIFSK